MGKTRQSKDTLGARMKANYEDRSRHFFSRRTYTLVRVDGRAFHTWTRGLQRPYDVALMQCMDAVAVALCEELAGAQCAFVQSDEVSILLTDFDDIDTQAWFDGSQSKIESVSASIATMAFNRHVMALKLAAEVTHAMLDDDVKFHKLKIASKEPNATFDSRAWVIPDPIEVENYFIWRQQDAIRNSVTMLASAYASHKELHGKSASQRHDIIHKAGDNWARHSVSFKHGRIIKYYPPSKDRVYTKGIPKESNWKVDNETPSFQKQRQYLKGLIPLQWAEDAQEKK
jgi:tRNA(His) guanylyltransferase